MASLTVVRPGMLTTVQDLGRWGYQASGVPVAGPMDEYAHRLANRLVQNTDDAAALEVTLIGPELQASGQLMCAVAGAKFELTVSGTPVPMHEAFIVPDGARLRFGPRSAGARATLAVRGGFDLEPVFGSRATSIISRIGPFGGRALAAGDHLPIGRSASSSHATAGEPMTMPAGGACVRVLVGPHDDRFTAHALEMLLGSRYTVTAQSNRMGYRLDGPTLRHAGSADILSDATPIGSLQVPGSGQPILLMADRQTTGGYPKIATVISADLPLAGQLAPGDWIEFEACTREAALEALVAQAARSTGSRR
jgi:biotin-dependent carboxylase-like uncharacterized protein